MPANFLNNHNSIHTKAVLKKKSIFLPFLIAFIFLSSLICFCNFWSVQYVQIFQSSFLFLLLSASVFYFKLSQKIELNSYEVVFLSFLIYLIIKDWIIDTGSIYSSFSFVVFFYLYIFLKKINCLLSEEKVAKIITILIFIELFTLICWHIFLKLENSSFSTISYFPNNSSFGIFLATQISLFAFLLSKKLIPWVKTFRHIGYFLIVTSTLILLELNSRSAVIGLCGAFMYTYIKRPYTIRKVLCIITFSCALVFIIYNSSTLKHHSSLGRILIYNVSSQMVKKHPLIGYGTGSFSSQYLHYQSQYFKNTDINSQEAMLADNTIYAFNDVWQLVIEQGLIGLFFIFIVLLILVRSIRIYKSNQLHLRDIAIVFFISLLPGILFSYPLQLIPIAIQAVFILSLIRVPVFDLSFFKIKYRYALTIPIAILCIIHCVTEIQFQIKHIQAKDFLASGFKHQALQIFSDLSNSQNKDPGVLYSYAELLFNAENYSSAKIVVDKARVYTPSSRVFLLAARIEAALGQDHLAIEDYLTAIYMVPSKMQTRKELMDFYLGKHHLYGALYWANSIVHMPIKIKSAKADNIKYEAFRIADSLTTKLNISFKSIILK